MSALALTRSQIMVAGLDLAARPDLISQARLWLNLYLERQYFNQDFDWLVKFAPGLAVADGTPFPTDYRAAKAAVITGPSGSQSEIQILANKADYDYKLVSYGNSVGCAKYGFADHDLRQFFFLPKGSIGYTMDLRYYYIPALPDFTDPSTDSATVKWGLPIEILIDHVKGRAMEYSDDARQNDAAKSNEDSLVKAKFNNQDKRAGSSRFPMGKRFRNRFK